MAKGVARAFRRIAKSTGHGHSLAEINEMGLGTSKHLIGTKPAMDPVQRLKPKNDGLAEVAEQGGVRRGMIGG